MSNDLIEPVEAENMGMALLHAARECPVRQLRTYLEVLGKEWRDAAEIAVGDEDAVIELASSVTTGMVVHHGYLTWGGGHPLRVNRRTNGGTSLHLTDPDYPQGRYLNFLDPERSPVVVSR